MADNNGLPTLFARAKSWISIQDDSWVYNVRWILYLVNAGLVFALLIFLGRFAFEIGMLAYEAEHYLFSTEKGVDQVLMMKIVMLLDHTMIISLLIMTIMGGHQIYIRRFKETLQNTGPSWLRRVDTIVLKVKMGLAFTGVSSVMILKDLMSVDLVPHEVWITHIAIHMTFMITTLLTAIVWRIMHPKDENGHK